MTREREPNLRADARRNRALILHTADRLLAERGASVTLNEIAHAAGIGVATVYRRFPDLQALFNTLFTERFTTFQEYADAAARIPEPGEALLRYLRDSAEWRASDPSLEHILANASLESRPIAAMRDELGRAVDGMVERALSAGAVRSDFASADVYTFLFIIGALADRTRGVAPDAWRRYAEILVAGYGLASGPAPWASAMTDEELREAWPKPPAAHQGPGNDSGPQSVH